MTAITIQYAEMQGPHCQWVDIIFSATKTRRLLVGAKGTRFEQSDCEILAEYLENQKPTE